MEPHFYNVELTWVSERKGEISSAELNTTIEVATPPQFPKGMAGIWSPEHLFTAAISSCFMTTFLSIAENSRLEFVSLTCSAHGKLEQIEGKFLMTEVVLFPKLKIKIEADKEKAERILKKSEAACLISNSVKASVTLQPNISW